MSARKLEPATGATPRYSDTVAPRSANVSRTPRYVPPRREGEYARTGTYSRVWSVCAVNVGSQPWSAEMNRISSCFIDLSNSGTASSKRSRACLLYTSDAADDLLCVDLGGR